VTDSYRKELEILLSEPIEHVRQRERTEFDRQLAHAGGRVVLFGAGNLGKKALARLRSVGIEPLAFSDNAPAKWGTEVEGLPVLKPNEAAAKFGQQCLFLVTVWSPRSRHRYRETRHQLQTLGCREVSSCCALYWKFADQMLPDFARDLPHKVFYDTRSVIDAAALWSDDCSRREYFNNIRWRALGDLAAMNAPTDGAQYFPGVYRPTLSEVFIDCGAYDGDTVREFIRHNFSFEQILALEPDPSNYQRLEACVQALPPDAKRRVTILNAAVGSRKESLSFRADGSEGARLANDGDVVIECLPVDDLPVAHPTFIKMDIEGAELNALRGAEKTIKKAPLLAICVYHSQSDLWRIPLFIQSVNPDYKFYLRPHDNDGWDVVCYAVPPDRVVS